MNPKIPKGLCQCGCGGKTKIAKTAHPERNQIAGEPCAFICGHATTRERNHLWKGGRKTNSKGYCLVLAKNHPRADVDGYVREHILIAEKVLGKFLPLNAVIHHVNETRNSGPLVICQDDNYHKLLHLRMRAYKACGHVNWRKCIICKQYDAPENLFMSKDKKIYHKSCFHEYRREKYKSKKNQSNP
jgi:hypothetical protein